MNNTIGDSAMKNQVIKLLLVDDEESILKIISTILGKKEELEVITANSGSMALDILANQKVDIVISDYQMPKMNGLELLQKLREKDKTKPFILLTGRGREDIAIKALNLGASYYTKKTADVSSVVSELLHVISDIDIDQEPDIEIEIPDLIDKLSGLQSIGLFKGDIEERLKLIQSFKEDFISYQFENNFSDWEEIFKALGNKLRLAILALITHGINQSFEIEHILNVSQPTVSHHLKILSDAGIVKLEKSGKWNVIQMEANSKNSRVNVGIELLKCLLVGHIFNDT